MNFSQGHSGTKVPDVNRACFPFLRNNTRTHKNGRNSWIIRFGPFFGLPGRLLIQNFNETTQRTQPYWKALRPWKEYRAEPVRLVSFLPLTEFRGESSVSSLSAYYCDKANSPSFFAELTEFAQKLSEAQRVLFSETVSLVFFCLIFFLIFRFFSDFPCLFCVFLLLFQGF